ncbi:DedA family protein (plasmid) [Roseomonas sp. OT10]|uniref:YqaA family protein n=1 Tax=Roseomonas cutis TaxID=2897332 RepID=UPI001E4FA555|nr:YqaA family protein [Roseomonas sp. OT10]UFN51707.1 DedA family protein [Roseomonas sp. OT10]
MNDLPAYGALLAAAFLAATLLPAQSEAVLAGLILADRQPVSLLVLTASLGNVAGSTVNWWLGRGIERFRSCRWFPVPEAGLRRAQGWFARLGRWSLLLAWLPVVGDPLTLVAGVMRVPLGVFLLLVTIGKVARYLVVAWMAGPSGT